MSTLRLLILIVMYIQLHTDILPMVMAYVQNVQEVPRTLAMDTVIHPGNALMAYVYALLGTMVPIVAPLMKIEDGPSSSSSS